MTLMYKTQKLCEFSVLHEGDAVKDVNIHNLYTDKFPNVIILKGLKQFILDRIGTPQSRQRILLKYGRSIASIPEFISLTMLKDGLDDIRAI